MKTLKEYLITELINAVKLANITDPKRHKPPDGKLLLALALKDEDEIREIAKQCGVQIPDIYKTKNT